MFPDGYKVNPAQPQAIPAEYRERAGGVDLAARVTALHKSQALSTQPDATKTDRHRAAAEAVAASQKARDVATARPSDATTARQKPCTALDAMREANRAKTEAQRKAGLIV